MFTMTAEKLKAFLTTLLLSGCAGLSRQDMYRERRESVKIRKYIFACLFSIHNTINLSYHEQVCLSGLRFERYFS